MTQAVPESAQQTGRGTPDIRPFRFTVSDADVADLRRRVSATKWPEKEWVPDSSDGVPLHTMQNLAKYWASEYNWKKCEAKLNALPQFTTEINGLAIHFIHVKSKQPNALPVIITHGWPGSIIEQLKIIAPLTNPTAFGGTAADAFDVVIPSLPGYGFSGKPTAADWNPVTIARAWAELMQRLGYTRYVAQGGDWGNAVSEVMALQQPPGLLGISTNMAATVPPRSCRPWLVERRLPRPCQRTNGARGTSSTSSTRKDSATPTRWGSARRRCTGSPIRPSGSRPG